MGFLEVQKEVLEIKKVFSEKLGEALSLTEVSAPLYVNADSGLQDNLNGIEKPVSFCASNSDYEIVHSLAKWKRLFLSKSDVSGIYTNMKALRPDEDLSPIHSVYVDQWDWEKKIKDRNLGGLTYYALAVYKAIKDTHDEFGLNFLPTEITFIHTQALLNRYPTLTKSERERAICEKHGAVFLVGIGGELSDGMAHDGRAPDYDDWTTDKGLNGDILVWNPTTQDAFELSSMGIRVDADTLKSQLGIRGCLERLNYPWHKALMSGELVQTIGGGIGQSRLAMLLLGKENIREVQTEYLIETMLEK